MRGSVIAEAAELVEREKHEQRVREAAYLMRQRDKLIVQIEKIANRIDALNAGAEPDLIDPLTGDRIR